MPRNWWFQLVVIVLALGSGVIGTIFKKLQEQAAKKRVQDELMRREVERLRTGRDPDREDASSAERARREAEVARRRKAQLEELRRRAAQRGASAGPAPTTAGATASRPAAVVVAPSPADGRVSRGKRSRASKASVPAPPLPSRASEASSSGPRAAARARAAASAPGGSLLPRAASAADSPETKELVDLLSSLRGFTAPRSVEELRRAVVLKELLDLPVSLRDEGR
jgi:hypothetical protein